MFKCRQIFNLAFFRVLEYGILIVQRNYFHNKVKKYESFSVTKKYVGRNNNLNDIIITRNHFKNCAEVFELSSVKSEASDCNNITFNYNILEHCGWHYAGGASYIMKIRNSDIIKNFDNVSICNNVIIGDQIASNYGILVECHGTMTNINIKNNIVEHVTTRAWLIITNNGTMNGFHADYNNLYDNANSNLPSDPLQNDKSEIVITDLAGKQVYNGPVQKEEKVKQIDVSGSRSGIYVMMIKDKEILVTKKFIKN
jgi:hypothetical protein